METPRRAVERVDGGRATFTSPMNRIARKRHGIQGWVLASRIQSCGTITSGGRALLLLVGLPFAASDFHRITPRTACSYVSAFHAAPDVMALLRGRRIDRSGGRCAAFGFFSWRCRSRLTPVFSPRVWTSQCLGPWHPINQAWSITKAYLVRVAYPIQGQSATSLHTDDLFYPATARGALRLPSRACCKSLR